MALAYFNWATVLRLWIQNGPAKSAKAVRYFNWATVLRLWIHLARCLASVDGDRHFNWATVLRLWIPTSRRPCRSSTADFNWATVLRLWIPFGAGGAGAGPPKLQLGHSPKTVDTP